ncbi:MAG: hypothetical protein OXB86_00785 [Bdellovibrionales bacterium]|nr:hypothetical protein [Bdellovibrionales bacterium]
MFLANNDSMVFNPFMDYSELQDKATEQESINFFEHGRSLTVIVYGGYEAITLNMSHIYGDAPAVFGVALSFFFDLNFAMQINATFPRSHYNSLLLSHPSFSNYGMDFKYYFNKQYLVKGIAKLNPYIIFGPFWLNITGYNNNQPPSYSPLLPPAAPGQAPTGEVPSVALAPPSGESNGEPNSVEESQVFDFNAFGAKIGLGIEIPLIKQTYLGIEIAYLYSNLYLENEDLSGFEPSSSTVSQAQNFLNWRIFPHPPSSVKGWRAHGDMVTGIFLLGVNF